MSVPDGEAVAFLGIPYAASGRFLPPSDAPSWQGERECTRFGPGAPQRPDRATGFTMSEQGCLNLNVWKPATPTEGAAVLVWIHGGAHLYGSNTHPLCDGARMAAAHGLVVVAINYRLGALGYLTLDHLLGPGYTDSANLALLDAIAALRWVHATIDAFGGDPANVTVMGQSAGAAMVATLLGMPATAGLFRRAIVQSGSGERAEGRAFGEERTSELISLLGLDDSSAERLLELPARAIVAAQENVIARRSTGSSTLNLAFRPTIDGRWLRQLPVHAIASGLNAQVDLLTGTNLHEGSGYVDVRHGAAETFLPDLEARLAAMNRPGVQRYRAALDQDTGRSSTAAEALEACIADQLYRQPTQRLLDARAAASGATYGYLFRWGRAGHSLELPFIFRHVDDSDAARLEVGPGRALPVRDFMSAAWAAFARTGKAWDGYEPQSRTTMIIDEHPHIQHDPRGALRRLFSPAGTP